MHRMTVGSVRVSDEHQNKYKYLSREMLSRERCYFHRFYVHLGIRNTMVYAYMKHVHADMCPMLKGQCLYAWCVSSVHVSDEHQNKYKYPRMYMIR